MAHNLCVKVEYTAYEVDLGIRKLWVTGDKVKRAPENLKLADPTPSVEEDVEAAESGSDEKNSIGDGNNLAINRRLNRRYYLRPSPAIVQTLESYYTHRLRFSKLRITIKSILYELIAFLENSFILAFLFSISFLWCNGFNSICEFNSVYDLFCGKDELMQ